MINARWKSAEIVRRKRIEGINVIISGIATKKQEHRFKQNIARVYNLHTKKYRTPVWLCLSFLSYPEIQRNNPIRVTLILSIFSIKAKVFGNHPIKNRNRKCEWKTVGGILNFPPERRSQWSDKIPYIFEQITITTVVSKVE